jgi:hypothetical protein
LALARSSLAAFATVDLLFSAFFLAISRRSRLVLACGCGSKTGELAFERVDSKGDDNVDDEDRRRF